MIVRHLLLGAVLLLGAGCGEVNEGPLHSLPRSLSGTDADGTLEIDESGSFIFNQQALDWFDYFLSAEGEVDDFQLDEVVRTRMNTLLGEEVAQAEAWSTWLAYRAYRMEARELLAEADVVDVDTTARALTDARIRILGVNTPVVDGAKNLRAAAEVRTILTAPNLSAAERRTRIESRLSRTGGPIDHDVRDRLLVRLRAATRNIGTVAAEELAAVRGAIVSKAATRRLAELDRRRSQWRRRVEDYAQRRRRLQVSIADPAERAEAVASLRQARFRGPEQRRVLALERLGRLDAEVAVP